MKLYFSPGACSLSPHIVACELGINLDLVKVNLGTKNTSDNRDFTKINPKGYVPALELDDGRILTEGPAIVQYLADLHLEKGLAPKCGTFERAKVQEWLTYIGTELHKNFGPLFNRSTTDADKQAAKEKLHLRLDYAEEALSKSSYLAAGRFSVADAYLYTVLSWCDHVGIDLKAFPAMQRYFDNLSKRESIIAATQAEKSA